MVGDSGQSTSYFGPYYLDIGCTSTAILSNAISNSGSFSATASTRNVGAATAANFYTFYNPSSDARSAYCSVINNYAKDDSSGATDSTKVTEYNG